MKVKKVINNNLVQSVNEQGLEVLVMGCGLGFKRKSGDEIADSLIEKVYIYEQKNHLEQLKSLLSQTPLEQIQAVNEIVSYARMSLGKKLNENIYIALTDHIHFAVSRVQEGVALKNALLWEIKRFYNHEYLVGKEALAIIERRLGITLPEVEAGFIALHFVNASMDSGGMVQATEMTAMIQNILNIVKYHFQMDLNEYTIHYERFITHLKFLVERILTNTPLVNDDASFLQILKEQYQKEYQCSLKVREYVSKEYSREMTEDELVYLTVHIKRVTM